MDISDERVEVEIKFLEEGEEIPVAYLSDLLAQLENMYIVFEQNRNLLNDISPYEINEEIFYDEESRDIFIGRLYRYNVLNQLEYHPRIIQTPPQYMDGEYQGLSIKNIRKESPLVISILGGGAFVAVLWIIEGIKYERETSKKITKNGDKEKEIDSKLEFNATSTEDLLSEIRKFIGR